FLATLPPWPSGCDWPFRHSRAPFGDLTAGLDRTHTHKSFDAPCLCSIFSRVNSYDFDVAIIGGGSGGYAAARTAAGAGLNTVVIEGGQEVGGLCILRGCMPTKALLYAAEVLHLARKSQSWGLGAPQVRFDFAEVLARK